MCPLYNPPTSQTKISFGSENVKIDNIRFTGSVSANISGNTAIININGLANAKLISIDFGNNPIYSTTAYITDSDITHFSYIVALQSGSSPSGKSADENEMDTLVFSCESRDGGFILNAKSITGPVVGKFNVNYIIV